MTDNPYRFVVLHRDGLPPSLDAAFRAASVTPPLLLLARALASSHVWSDGPPVSLVARPEPTPVLAAIGRFEAADEARLVALHRHLQTVLQRTIYLDHRRAEAACEALAEGLQSRYSRDDLARMRFVGIPRGGSIVLGMLAYALGLSRHQLEAAPTHEDPLVIVDDCVLSGLRLSQFLEARPEGSVVVATLFSHPDLRAALLARSPHVRDVVSAFDLFDHAPAALGSEYDAWRARWQARSDPRTLWIGQPDHVCFPWGEPETSSWNPVTDREEIGWHVIPPELCLKHRHAARGSAIATHLQRTGEGAYGPTDRIVVGEIEGAVVIGDLEADTTYALEGISADMWRAVLTCRDLHAAAATLSATYDVDQETVRADVATFVEELVAAGILERERT
jgi:hypothetical protein